MDIYVGNLAFTANEDDIGELFESYGGASSIKLITDRETGKSRGFAFVTVDDQASAQSAIEELNGQEFMGRELRIREATPRPARPSGGGGEGGYRGGGATRGGYQGGGSRGHGKRDRRRGDFKEDGF